jgi:D-alanyl-D-alanine carboxypeptidase
MSISRRSLVLASATSAAALPALALAHDHATPTTTTPVADAADREARVLAAMEQHGIPGAIVLHDSPESGLWKAALGVADLETGDPMTIDMHMRIASITKTFTSTMILQLVDQGALALDDTLATLLPSQAALPNADAITIRHLLTMQSGLPDYVTPESVLEGDPHATMTDDEVVGLIDGMDANFTPGQQTAYSNTNYILLGMIATEITGTHWAELVQTGVLDEAGLAHTTIPTGPELPSPSPRGYVYEAALMQRGTPSATPAPDALPADMTLIDPTLPGAAGNMISTVDDLYTWMRVLMDGSLLSPELQADRLDFSDEGVIGAPNSGLAYGLGLSKVEDAIGHDGGITGFRSSMLAVPDTGEIIITLANVIPARDGGDPAEILMNAVLGE